MEASLCAPERRPSILQAITGGCVAGAKAAVQKPGRNQPHLEKAWLFGGVTCFLKPSQVLAATVPRWFPLQGL